MNIETIKLPVADLIKGMMIVKLDRPWLETPFKLQGFRIEKNAELAMLAQYCKHVYIDVERGPAPPPGKGERVMLTDEGEEIVPDVDSMTMTGSLSRAKLADARARAAAQLAIPPPAADYPIALDFSDELPAARAAVAATKIAVRELMQAVAAGERTDLEPVKSSAAALEESVLRNPDPALLLRALATTELFSLRHCVNSAILAIALARELGLKRQPIHELTMGVLLADIGKIRVPKELLRTKRRLTGREIEVVKLHVRYGVDIARSFDGLTRGTIEIIGSHHERFNGSGYPMGTAGGELSLAVRIAGLVDSVDAITSERAYSTAIPIHEVMQELYAANVEVFQRDLIERFFHAMGTYPAGTVVALSDGCLALVVAQNRHRRLLPRVIRLADANKNAINQRDIVDLAVTSGPLLTVREVIDPATYGIARPTTDILTT